MIHLFDKIKSLLSILLFIILTTVCAQAQMDTLNIQLKKHDSLEVQTKRQLLKLIAAYDTRKWIFTKEIVIESGYHVIPHSHPVLTLNTRHLKDDDLLLSTFVHEQLHWYINDHQSKNKILDELKLMYPQPKIHFPEGSGGEFDTYFHIMICHLEYKALKMLLGELKAFQIVLFWQQDHYKWIYKTVIEDQIKLDGLVRKYNLMPK